METEPVNKPDRLVLLYDKGVITLQEVMYNICQLITSDNVAKMLDSLPTEISDELIVTARIVPDPQSLKTFCLGSFIIRNEQEHAEFQRTLSEAAQAYRDGLQAVKDYVLANDLF